MIATVPPPDAQPPVPDEYCSVFIQLTGGTAQLSGQLATTDPRDRALEDSHCKVYTLSMTAGRTYQIDMTSSQFDAYLRLESEEGKQVAYDDDGAGVGLNAKMVYNCDKAGTYTIFATSFEEAATGEFHLRARVK